MAALSDLAYKCIFVLGPTSSGKSAWALEQAVHFGGSVVNIDSVQFYEGLLIGSAAPTEAEKKMVPHYLYSYVQAPHEMTAGRYTADFYKLLQEQKPKGPLFITGGTGFYIQALEKGMFNIEPVPAEVREELEAELVQQGAEKLWNELNKKDPSHKIHVNDHYRLVRALEIIRHTGQRPSELKANSVQNKNGLPYASIKIGFDFEKDEFAKRVQQRTEAMLGAGLIEETESFIKKGHRNWAPLQSVGYRETVEYLEQNHSREWLRAAIQQSTMKLIKKQKTWFKRDQAVLWSDQLRHLARFLS